jgi:hypothetical protein
MVGTNISEGHAASIFRVTWCHNPEDHELNLHHCKDVKSHTFSLSSSAKLEATFFLHKTKAIKTIFTNEIKTFIMNMAGMLMTFTC